MREWKFPSSSSSAIYTTQINPSTGLLSCSCKGWTTKKLGKPRDCKHCKQVVIDEGLQVEIRDEQQFVNMGFPAPVTLASKIRKQVVAENQVAIDILAAHDGGFISPMLASKMPDGLDADFYATDDYVLEEKMDGHRIMVRVANKGNAVTAWSRLGNTRTLPAHIDSLMSYMPDGVYDGELIIPGMHSSDVVAGMNSGQEVLVLFDMLETNGSSIMNEPFSVRRQFLETAFEAIGPSDIVKLAYQTIPSVQTVKEIWNRGGEGAILKRLGAKYSPGWRTPDWIKCKQELTAVLVITGFTAGKSGPFSIINLRGDDGMTTTVKSLDNDMMRQFAANPDSYIGKRLIVHYQEKTSSGKLRHIMAERLAGEYE